MKLIEKAFFVYVIAINCFAYALMCYDKHQAKKKGKRIPENKLFIVAFAFGALGVYLGMKAPIYHKAAKAKFKWGIPFIIILNIISVYFIYKYK